VTRLYFFSLLLVALALGPGLAHVLELPNKIGLSAQEYMTVQQIYRGWAWLGAVLLGALGSTLGVAVSVREVRPAFTLALIAFFCLASQLAVFFLFTYPVNRLTENWTFLPEGWEALRVRWEYSHAVSALLVFAALAALVGSLLAAAREGALAGPFLLQVPRGMRRS
jgi:hypothetical protein